MTPREAEDIAGKLSTPSKMPGFAYGLPALECKTGSVLAKVAGSVCSKCYALKGRYGFPAVQNAQYRRLKAMNDPRWVDAMVTLIQHHNKKSVFFRWHDSGDLQDVGHLEKIVKIAQACPKTYFWLPTREKIFVNSYLRAGGVIPQNLVIRVSGTMIDGPPPVGFKNTSTVVTDKAAVTCPAWRQGNQCGNCRACWDPAVANVSYPKH